MAKQQSVLPEKIAKQRKCPLCGCFFVPDKMMRTRCEGCEPVLGGPLNPAVRQLAEDLEKQGKTEAVMEQDIPTRDQVEMMIRTIVKEELAAMPAIVGNLGPTSVADSGQPIVGLGKKKEFKDRVFKPRNCIKCGNPFTPRIGFQKICDNCRAKAKEQK